MEVADLPRQVRAGAKCICWPFIKAGTARHKVCCFEICLPTMVTMAALELVVARGYCSRCCLAFKAVFDKVKETPLFRHHSHYHKYVSPSPQQRCSQPTSTDRLHLSLNSGLFSSDFDELGLESLSKTQISIAFDDSQSAPIYNPNLTVNLYKFIKLRSGSRHSSALLS